MKINRLISFVVAVLITVFLARFFTSENLADPQDRTNAAARAP